jgi:hypothetical protein
MLDDILFREKKIFSVFTLYGTTVLSQLKIRLELINREIKI